MYHRHLISGVPHTPLRALDKQLRDGRHLIVDLVPDTAGGTDGWMRAEIDGQPVGGPFTAPVQRDVSPVPGMPHVIQVPIKSFKRAPVGLTAAEADGIEQAQHEWHDRHRRALLAAAPNAETTVETTWHPAQPGDVINLDGRPRIVTEVLAQRWIAEDGESLGVGADAGYLYDLRVRDLTAHEHAALDAHQAEASKT